MKTRKLIALILVLVSLFALAACGAPSAQTVQKVQTSAAPETTDEYGILVNAARCVREKTDLKPEVAIVLGTGLGGISEKINVETTIKYDEIEGLPVSTVQGHEGQFLFGYIESVPVVVMQGRVHCYEGYSSREVVRPIRLMNMLGAETIILTNSSGAINSSFKGGELMMISDHILYGVQSPLIGPNITALGDRFPDQSEVYDKELRSSIRSIASSLGIDLKEGVYLQDSGPNYETPAEVKMLRGFGADAAGMSTGIEAVAANHAGMRVCGISCVTCAPADISSEQISDDEVQKTAARMADELAEIIINLVPVINNPPAEPAEVTTGVVGLERDNKFGSVFIHNSIEEFLSHGFEYGDSVNVEFSNGFKMKDVPFYNGYNVRIGEPVVVAYPGYKYIAICINNGELLYDYAKLTPDDTAVVTLAERGKYIETHNAMNLKYTNERSDYASDEVFANFRVMRAGNLAEGLFYRGASPCDNQYNRAPFVSALCEKAGVKFFIDLADGKEEAEQFYNDSSVDNAYWKSLYEKGAVLPLDIAANYRNEEYAYKIATAMKAILKEDGPFYIHCTEGKDRTGFVCALLEVLAGGSYDEVEDDYMKTYENYYGLSKEDDPARYNKVAEIKFYDIIATIVGTDDESSVTPESALAGAKDYLIFGGMTDSEINALIEKITK